MEIKTKRLLMGRVVSKKMQKTATVLVERTYEHAAVHKVVTTNKKFHVHDPLDSAKVGDMIEFFEGRHISKSKYMHLHAVVAQRTQQVL